MNMRTLRIMALVMAISMLAGMSFTAGVYAFLRASGVASKIFITTEVAAPRTRFAPQYKPSPRPMPQKKVAQGEDYSCAIAF